MNKPLIRLHYIWFKDYFGFHNQGINLSTKYNFSYDPSNQSVKELNKNKNEYIDQFFGRNIDVTAIVGQNGVGKTSLLRFVLKLRSGDLIDTECVIVFEKDSELRAFKYYQDSNGQYIGKEIAIEGNKETYKDERLFDELNIQRFPFARDIRFIYMTEMFNMSQYESPISGGDDLSFAAILHEQTEDGYEEKHIQNPVVRYIHRITDRQLQFFANGAEYVEQFHINYPSFVYISPNYDREAFIKLYVSINSKNTNKTKEYHNNDYEIWAKKLSNKFFGTIKDINDEYAKAIIMNIISSFEYDADDSYEKRNALFSMIKQFYSSESSTSESSTWKSTYSFLRNIKESNDEYNNWLNNNKNQIRNKKSLFYVDAEPYIKFMDYLSEILNSEGAHILDRYTICIPTSKMKKIQDFVNSYRKCVHIVDFLSFSWGLSSGETLLLNQFGKLMHLFEKDDIGYYLPEDVNSKSIANNAVIMLDEAEVSFHPEWQRVYFNAFLNFIERNICKHGTHVQLIIATHSPIILSDIPKQNTVFLKNDKSDARTICVGNKETFAANIFSLYQNAFFMGESEIGAFAENKLCKLVKDIHKLFDLSDHPDEETNKKVCQQISLSGDQYIRRKFEKEYQYYKDNYYSTHPDMRALDEEIAAKKQELVALLLKRKELGE